MSGDVVHPGDPALLVGTWVGNGHGDYPTIEPFGYVETLTIAAVPDKPLLTYSQRTNHPDTGAPMHSEVGYLRFPQHPPATAEFVLSQPTGVSECHLGTIRLDAGRTVIDLASVSVACTPSAKEVTSVRRRLVVDAEVLTSELWMAAVGQPDTLHLRATLLRQPGDPS